MPRLCGALVHFYGWLIFEEGYFPCDPHSSNLMLRRASGSSQPQLVLIDFGQMASIDSRTRGCLAQIIHALTTADDDAASIHQVCLSKSLKTAVGIGGFWCYGDEADVIRCSFLRRLSLRYCSAVFRKLPPAVGCVFGDVVEALAGDRAASNCLWSFISLCVQSAS